MEGSLRKSQPGHPDKFRGINSPLVRYGPGPRTPIRASGVHKAASKGRTHDRTQQNYAFSNLEPGPAVGGKLRAKHEGIEQIVTAHAPIGPTRDWLDAAQPSLDAAGIRLAEVQRDWDCAVWPQATAGFFKVKKRTLDVLRAMSPLSYPAC